MKAGRVALIILALTLTLGCGSSKGKSEGSTSVVPRVNCPDQGDCSFEVLQNSTLVLNRDQSGRLLPQIEEGDKVVIRYHFKKREEPNSVDGSHSEYILFEIEPGRVELILNDQDLQRVKMTFGRICYCKGSNGYFPVTQGKLFVYQNKGHLQVRSEFKMKKVPQIIQGIDENLHYYPKK